MIKRNIIVFIFISLGVFGLSGCNSDSKLSAEGNIISLKISYAGSSMLQYSGYSYYLCEENGEILFDAHLYIVGEDVREITLDKAVATQEDMEALRNICEEYNLAEKQKTSRTYKIPFWRKIMSKHISDGPVSDIILEAVWENGATLFISPDNTSDLLNFFKELAIRLNE